MTAIDPKRTLGILWKTFNLSFKNAHSEGVYTLRLLTLVEFQGDFDGFSE